LKPLTIKASNNLDDISNAVTPTQQQFSGRGRYQKKIEKTPATMISATRHGQRQSLSRLHITIPLPGVSSTQFESHLRARFARVEAMTHHSRLKEILQPVS
jgi:hypothetical protein